MDRKIFKIFLISIVTLMLLLFIGFFLIMYINVANTCRYSKLRHKKDCVESLIADLQSYDVPVSERNKAIWTLGQLADQRALIVLRSMYEGVPNHKEPLDEVISQYEIQKAINWCENGNFTSWIYVSVK